MELKTITENLLKRLPFENRHLVLMADEAYRPAAETIRQLQPLTEIRALSSAPPEDLPQDAAVLVLAEPDSYLRFQLYRYLDFDLGEPRIRDRCSRVYVFPRDSLYRIFAEDPETDRQRKTALLTQLQPDRRYRITAPGGTNLTFTARQWIGLDFEVCTAPVETSVRGVIAADGALFFRKIDETLFFTIENGQIRSIQAASPTGEELLADYQRMTADAFRNPVNRQLAEIGIGFCRGARISDCFMEAEAADHTCHFCFGSNICYGGKNESSFHGASVLVRDPSFTSI